MITLLLQYQVGLRPATHAALLDEIEHDDYVVDQLWNDLQRGLVKAQWAFDNACGPDESIVGYESQLRRIQRRYNALVAFGRK